MTTSVPLHPTHHDGTPLSIQLFTIEGTRYGPYVALPVSSVWTPLSAHLFTRATAQMIVADMHRDDCGLHGAFDAETGTLTFTDDGDTMETVAPDAYGRYLIGGLWDWDEWGDHVPHTAGQAEFARGAAEYRQDDDAASLVEPLDTLYRQGRQEAQLVARERAEHRGVLFDVDPSRTPYVITRRPTNFHFRPLPAGAYESAARIVLARDVRAGDLVVGSFATYPNPGRATPGTSWARLPYLADPRPANTTCTGCANHPHVELSEPENTVWGVERDEWDADEPVLVIPAALLQSNVSA
ncbi:hypothetical protein [Streptomyces noursei]|uniref:hypothetical protein n=1 Tax=Streptomyces noursei TaxID=1971 RepID=UPI0023B81392|nr:hypothetical protein [Streptomyces noursei]